MRIFLQRDAGTPRFWTIEQVSARLVLAWGAIGSPGEAPGEEESIWRESSEEAAEELERLAQEKLREGYVEIPAWPLSPPFVSLPEPQATPTNPAPAARSTPLLEALQASVVENPDDRAAHAAYADLLQELGDPRGEFISVQLALEDRTLSARKRSRLEQREQDSSDISYPRALRFVIQRGVAAREKGR